MKTVTFSKELERKFYIEKSCPLRNGSHWIRCSLDRYRFNDRIKNFFINHGYILTECHREKMYQYIMSKQ